MVWTISAELRKQVEITGRGLKTETISTGTSILTLALQHWSDNQYTTNLLIIYDYRVARVMTFYLPVWFWFHPVQLALWSWHRLHAGSVEITTGLRTVCSSEWLVNKSGKIHSCGEMKRLFINDATCPGIVYVILVTLCFWCVIINILNSISGSQSLWSIIRVQDLGFATMVEIKTDHHHQSILLFFFI